MSSESFLQDYIEEVQEHLLEMEKSLLILEQEGADQEQISHVFRAAHSLKGASAYMGFEGLAALTHEMETLISEIQLNSGSIPSSGISVMLECVDLISGAVEHVRKNGTEPALDTSFIKTLHNAFSPGCTVAALPDEIDPATLDDLLADCGGAQEVPVIIEEAEIALSMQEEEDEELLSIFINSFRETFSNLFTHLQSLPETSISADDVGAAREQVQKLMSSAKYMDYQPVLTILAELEKNLGGPNGDQPGKGELLERLQTCGTKLDKIIPGLGLCGDTASKYVAPQSPLREEDEELYAIFLDSFQQNFSRLAEIISSSGLTGQDFQLATELTGSLIQSSQYMDYEEIVEQLRGWEETLLKSEGRQDEDRAKLLETLSVLCSELINRLTGFKMPNLVVQEQREKPLFESIDAEIDRFFQPPDDIGPDLSDLFAGGSDATSGDSRPNEDDKSLSVQSGEPASDAPVQPPQPKASEGAEKKERTVLCAEEVQQSTVTLRVDAQKVDQLLNQVGELVVTRSEFIQTATLFRDVLRDLASQGLLPKSELRRLRVLGFRLNESTQSLGRVANDLQTSVMRVRMLPIMQLFERFPRIVRDQALKLGKKVELIIEGGETEIDKRVLERMNDPLIQFIRNALVHGIETPSDRRLAGKPESGTVRLAAYHSGDFVTIEIEDDGRGVDTKRLRELLRNHKEITEHELERLSDQEIAYAIFMPGVSTYAKVDGTAGRGVGLDVVKENVEHMNGSVEVETSPGLGTRFVIKIPLTVAIIRALLVKEAEQIFTLPLTSVSEILRYRPESAHSIEGFPVISLRGKTIPLVDLRRLLNIGADAPENRHRFVVIVSTSFREVGLVVDGLMGEREVVIKSIDNGFHPIEGFSGATILGDGRVSLIIDVSSMLKMMKSSFATRQGIQHSESLH